MGMYHEVFHRCPKCEEKRTHGTGIAQICQVGDATGFGNRIDFTDLRKLKQRVLDGDITATELRKSADYTKDEWFECMNCKETFQVDPAKLRAAELLGQQLENEIPLGIEARARAMLDEINND